MIWSKTYISICENTLVIERNTMNRMKYTIAASSISNVNMEQNLFEMLDRHQQTETGHQQSVYRK